MPTYREFLYTWDGPAAIHRLHHPVLLIRGNHDQLQPPAETDQLYTAANEPKEHRSIDAGHLPHLDATAEFADLVSGWLERIIQ
jgi:pimeloyl-ACP methyl ester carboxylesterase